MPTAAQAPYTLLVANFSRPTQSLIFGSDTSWMAPTKTRTGFVFQHVQLLGFAYDHTNATGSPGRSLVVSTTNVGHDPFKTDPPLRPIGTVTVSSDVFDGQSASLFIGPYELVSNRDFVTGGGAAVTATNIAAAVSALEGYVGSTIGADVIVRGPFGQGDEALRFFARYRGGDMNFTFAYEAQEGYLGYDVSGTRPEELEILPAGTPNGVAPP